MGLQFPRGDLLEKNLCCTILTRIFTSSASCRNLWSLSCTSLTLTNLQEWSMTELTPDVVSSQKENLCWLWWQINKDSKPARADVGCNARSVSCNTGLWQLNKKGETACMHVLGYAFSNFGVRRLIKWTQNEKWVKWPFFETKNPNSFHFPFSWRSPALYTYFMQG